MSACPGEYCDSQQLAFSGLEMGMGRALRTEGKVWLEAAVAGGGSVYRFYPSMCSSCNKGRKGRSLRSKAGRLIGVI